MLLAWLLFPLTLSAICAGLGLLLDALSGKRLPGALIAPSGFAVLLLFAQLASLAGASIALISTAAILLAGVGVAAAMPWRFGAPDPWAIGAAVTAFLLFAAPVLLSGELTFAAYGIETEIADWLTYAADDPVGAVLPFAVAQQLVGGEAAWHFQPYLAVLAALLSLCAWQAARAVGIDPTGVGESLRSRGVSHRSAQVTPLTHAAISFLAAIPVLVFGYAGWGGVQELAALVPLALASALTLDRRDQGETQKGPDSPLLRFTLARWVPLVLALAAALAALIPFSPLALDIGAWLATVALAAATVATVALCLWIASTQSRAAFALFAASLTATAVLASAGVALAPYERLEELRQIDQRFSGQSPALAFGDEPYAAYFLRDLPAEDAARTDSQRLPLHVSAIEADRAFPNTDDVDYRSLLAYPLLVIPRSPSQSRPPSPYRLAWLGDDYTVWRLPATATFRLLFHMPVGGPLNALGFPDCSQTVGLGLLALAGQLEAAPQDILLIAAPPSERGRPQATVTVPPDRARELCGRRWDWIEAISPAG